MNKSVLEYTIYTDGSTKGNGTTEAIGGWAYAIIHDSSVISKDCGAVTNTTNQRMELQAAIEAIKAVLKITKNNPTDSYVIYSDSAYLVNCYLQGWYKSWLKNGWINSKKQEVKNQDLWWELIPYFESNSWDFRKVKGHANDYYNNLVDELAQGAAHAYQYGGSAL